MKKKIINYLDIEKVLKPMKKKQLKPKSSTRMMTRLKTKTTAKKNSLQFSAHKKARQKCLAFFYDLHRAISV